jgi:putative Mn2+ efflux pump MntP
MFVGLVLGAELAQAIGEPADYVGAGVFVLLGAYLALRSEAW